MDIKATLETKISKSGNPYDVVMLQLTDSYERPVYLEKAEIELLKQYRTTKKDSDLEMPDFLS